MNAALAILQAYAAKRWTLMRLRTPADVQARQRRLLAHHLPLIARSITFYRDYASKPFAQWPILDKASALANFGDLNAHGISSEQAWRTAEGGLAAANRSGELSGLVIGTSSGTSGNRGLFLISQAERYRWLGSILARTLPDFPFVRHRIAVMLATGNALYETTQHSGRLDFAFHDLRHGIASHRIALEAFAPDVLVAPPKVLRTLAEQRFHLNPTTILSGGEVLDALDADIIRARYGVAPRSIYQATEGFIGAACKYSTIHLNEDDMIVERETVSGHPDYFVPVITDLRRSAQAMVRYRLNDILVHRVDRCVCGSPLLAIARIEGRCDDVIETDDVDGNSVTIMPDVIRATILDADRALTDFRFDQIDRRTFLVRIQSEAPPGAEQAIESAVQGMLARHGVGDFVINTARGIEEADASKLRRVRRLQSCEMQVSEPTE